MIKLFQISLFGFQARLPDADMAAIAALDRNDRLVSPDGLAPNWD